MDKLDKIFFHKLFTAIADSIIKVFIPLYILKMTGQIELSIIYLIVESSLVMVGMLALKKVLCSHGLLCIILHCIPIIITETLLSLFKIDIVIVLLCALCIALAQTLYSIPLNILFASISKNANVSKFQIATNVGKIFFIFLSGTLIAKVPDSFIFLSILASVFYIVSIIPLISTYHELKVHTRVKREVEAKKISIWHRLFHMAFSTFQITIETIIPLYLYINNLSFEAVSSIIAIIELLKVFANILGNRFVKSGRYKLSCIISTLIFTISFILIVLIKEPIVLYILSCVIAISFPLCFVPMFHLFCDKINLNKSLNRDMIDRDIDIFSIRPFFYGAYFITGTFLPCIILGFIGVTLQFTCQLKIIDEEKRLIKKELKEELKTLQSN
ncbi:MAG: hypothetical protein IJW28_05485 [Clostridia bacterium]|nr:hypothetical protein [Clostridia bacterium]